MVNWESNKATMEEFPYPNGDLTIDDEVVPGTEQNIFIMKYSTIILFACIFVLFAASFSAAQPINDNQLSGDIDPISLEDAQEQQNTDRIHCKNFKWYPLL
ncbi:hypothetical protein BDC45DRAFT_574789 [Circinella umbellata]|nr:hypothetical protein BDC45DRAFT_574789 [Circinella umbellata]